MIFLESYTFGNIYHNSRKEEARSSQISLEN